jgi:hypothetical protein
VLFLLKGCNFSLFFSGSRYRRIESSFAFRNAMIANNEESEPATAPPRIGDRRVLRLRHHGCSFFILAEIVLFPDCSAARGLMAHTLSIIRSITNSQSGLVALKREMDPFGSPVAATGSLGVMADIMRLENGMRTFPATQRRSNRGCITDPRLQDMSIAGLRTGIAYDDQMT